jgi:hypothetical protein
VNAIEAGFQPLYGLPCWNVKPGYGSFLTMEFGEPHLEIREPRQASRDDASEQVCRLLARRLVTVHGQWHLWIYCCHWSVTAQGKVIGDSTTKEGVRHAAEELDSQKLVAASVDPLSGCSTFDFDLGARLSTWPYREAESSLYEQWMLYEPSGMVLSFRADGQYSHHPGNTPPEFKEWRTLSGGNANIERTD